MSLTDDTTTLLDLEYAEIENLEQRPDSITVSFHLKRRPHDCPHCHSLTDTVHDYRIQYVKDIPVLGRPLLWKYRKRRYHCSCCGKHFFESNHLLPKWHRITSRLALYSFSLLVSDKVIKRTGFGYHNFHSFRKRILLIHKHCLSFFSFFTPTIDFEPKKNGQEVIYSLLVFSALCIAATLFQFGR